MTRPGWLYRLFDFVVPRFVTEDVVVEVCGDHFEIVCTLVYVEPGDRFDGIVAVREFSWLGFGFFPTVAGEVRPFVNPYDGVRP